MQKTHPPVVFSAVQATGGLHLGNYLGAIRRFAALQTSHACIFCVADLHAITLWQDPRRLAQNTREVAAAFLAAGIDPIAHIVFNQARVSGHTELAWIFTCVARLGWMRRMTQFKDKAGKDTENVSLGLLAYPALMAADILLYHGTHVPVGEDQKQHLEFTRDVAQKFNHDFADRLADLGFGDRYFPLTEPLIMAGTARVMSLRDGTKKMSKSDPADNSRINLIDDQDAIVRKIRRARTDSEPLPKTVDGLAGRPEAANLVRLYGALAGQSVADVLRDFPSSRFSTFKAALCDLAVSSLAPFTAEMERLMASPDHLDHVLKEGAGRARAIADKTMGDVRAIIGLLAS